MTDAIQLLVGTRKGAWISRSDARRESWRVQGPIFLGSIVNHLVLDPRDGTTMLMAASTGHLGPTIFRSSDGGETWAEAKSPPAFPKSDDPARGPSIIVSGSSPAIPTSLASGGRGSPLLACSAAPTAG